MATSHGKFTIITVATKDISPYCKNSSIERAAKTHDTTGYAPAGDAEVYAGGLKGGSFSCSGVYDNTALVGPRLVLNGIEGTIVAVTRKVEGTGTGKPLDTFNAILEKYTETNPHDDMVTWAADFKISGAITSSVQP
jgi:hypothetical protein